MCFFGNLVYVFLSQCSTFVSPPCWIFISSVFRCLPGGKFFSGSHPGKVLKSLHFTLPHFTNCIFFVLITKYLSLRIESSNQHYTFALFCDSSFIVIANSILLMSFSDGLLLWFSFLLSNGILREFFLHSFLNSYL